MSEVASEIEREVAHDLAELDRVAGELGERIGKIGQHVQAGHLSEGAFYAKVMELQTKLMGGGA